MAQLDTAPERRIDAAALGGFNILPDESGVPAESRRSLGNTPSRCAR
jgi:hypothetical protein